VIATFPSSSDLRRGELGQSSRQLVWQEAEVSILIDLALGTSLIACLGGLLAYEVRDRRRQRATRKRPGDLPELS
jgi:hypothetical protein